ncbi:hypothetical protein IscW_ISCW017330, partial [Ixodes scapularis]
MDSESRTPYFGADRSVQPEVPFKVRSSRKASITASSAMAPQHEPSVQAMQSTSQIKPALKAPSRKASMSAPTALQLQEKTSGKGQAKFSEQLPTTDSQPKFRSHVARRASVDIPGEAEGHLSGESAEQDKVEALMSVADGAPEGGSLEETQQTYSVDLDEKPEPAARKDINPAQQSFSQELPRHE